MWGREWESCNLRAHGTAIWGVFSPEPVSNKIPLYVHSPLDPTHRPPRATFKRESPFTVELDRRIYAGPIEIPPPSTTPEPNRGKASSKEAAWMAESPKQGYLGLSQPRRPILGTSNDVQWTLRSLNRGGRLHGRNKERSGGRSSEAPGEEWGRASVAHVAWGVSGQGPTGVCLRSGMAGLHAMPRFIRQYSESFPLSWKGPRSKRSTASSGAGR